VVRCADDSYRRQASPARYGDRSLLPLHGACEMQGKKQQDAGDKNSLHATQCRDIADQNDLLCTVLKQAGAQRLARELQDPSKF
jgi:hypothetical protein